MKIRCTRTLMQAITQITLPAALLIAASGCGGYYGYGPGSALNSASYSSGSSNYDLNSAGTISAVRVDSVGSNYQTLTIKANSRLRLKITAGQNDKNILNTGYTYSYSKLSVDVNINGTVQSTGDLRNGLSYSGSTSTDSVILDFSNALKSSASCIKAPGASCRNDVQITIYNPKYDFCQYQGYFGCAMNTPNVNHPWNVRVMVETDDTGSL